MLCAVPQLPARPGPWQSGDRRPHGHRTGSGQEGPKDGPADPSRGRRRGSGCGCLRLPDPLAPSAGPRPSPPPSWGPRSPHTPSSAMSLPFLSHFVTRSPSEKAQGGLKMGSFRGDEGVLSRPPAARAPREPRRPWEPPGRGHLGPSARTWRGSGRVQPQPLHAAVGSNSLNKHSWPQVAGPLSVNIKQNVLIDICLNNTPNSPSSRIQPLWNPRSLR